MENIQNYIKEAAQQRGVEVMDNIAAANPQYKQITKESSTLEAELTKDLSQDEWELMDKHRDLYLQREALVAALAYRQGFIDGTGVKALFVERETL